eukprot:GHVQ01018550.1.p1 GENE.GHVQ01018550.1~~GHVQ01018550.1.p1  ORF type:complete len:118 (+),score=6.39 GHVQ01018550.1:76-429(+)
MVLTVRIPLMAICYATHAMLLMICYGDMILCYRIFRKKNKKTKLSISRFSIITSTHNPTYSHTNTYMNTYIRKHTSQAHIHARIHEHIQKHTHSDTHARHARVESTVIKTDPHDAIE